MTTPANENTSYAIISDAMEDACMLPEGDDPNSEQLARYQRRLNQLIKELMTGEDGVRLWRLKDTSLTLFADQSNYTFGPTGTVIMPKPDQIYDQYYLYSGAFGGTRRPVSRISRQQWDSLSTTNQLGPITQIFVDPQQTQLEVNTWLVPDANEATGTLQLVFMNQVTSFVSVTDQMNFPLEWALALHWLLASQICMGQPAAVISRCDGMAAYYKQKLIEWDQEHETSILPQPDQRMYLPRRFGR